MVGLTALNVFVTPVTGLGVALRVSGSGWGAHWLGIADACLAAGAIAGQYRRHPLAADVRRGRGFPDAGASRAWRSPPWGSAGARSLVLAMTVLGFTAGAASVWLSAAFIRTIEAATSAGCRR